jgi:hypothetical protein
MDDAFHVKIFYLDTAKGGLNPVQEAGADNQSAYD